MPEYYLEYSHMNPLQMVPVDPDYDPRYNSKHFDDFWFSEQILSFEQPAKYYQPVQQNDNEITLQIKSTLGQPQTTFYDCNQRAVIGPLLWTLKPTLAVGQPWSIYEINLDFSTMFGGNPVPEGYYWAFTQAGPGPVAQLISEGIYVKAKHENTKLVQYTHHENDFDMMFETGYIGQLRAPIIMRPMDISFKRKVASYEDQILNRKNTSSVPYRSLKMILAEDDSSGVAPWFPEKINYLFCCSDVKIDGKSFVAESDELEKQSVVGYPKGAWTLDLREGVNRYSKRVFGVGDGPKIVVAYTINTNMFGPYNALPSTITVKLLDVEP